MLSHEALAGSVALAQGVDPDPSRRRWHYHVDLPVRIPADIVTAFGQLGRISCLRQVRLAGLPFDPGPCRRGGYRLAGLPAGPDAVSKREGIHASTRRPQD